MKNGRRPCRCRFLDKAILNAVIRIAVRLSRFNADGVGVGSRPVIAEFVSVINAALALSVSSTFSGANPITQRRRQFSAFHFNLDQTKVKVDSILIKKLTCIALRSVLTSFIALAGLTQ
jgi:hypothetical protein